MTFMSIAAFLGLSWYFSREKYEEISYQTFVHGLLAQNLVSKVDIVNSRRARIYLNVSGSEEPSYYISIPSTEFFEDRLMELSSVYGHISVRHKKEFNMMDFLERHAATLSFFAIFGLIIYSMFSLPFRRGFGKEMDMFGMGGGDKSKFVTTRPKVKFDDIAGCKEAKEEIMEFVHILKNPEYYQRLGAKIPRGALLVGPPGTGKTLLAKATAGESNVAFFSAAGSDFQELFVGMGAARIRELFNAARKNAPSIIFIDEIDSIGIKRSTYSHDESDNTLNQLLTEMDGFNVSKEPVVVFAGTNRHDVLDPALLRSGRFDRIIALDLPDIKARKEILEIHLKKIKLGTDKEDLAKTLAAMTPGFSGATLENLCNEAALIAARNDDPLVLYKHFEAAFERVIAGLEKKTTVLSEREKRTVAFHEAGHAVVSWFLEHGSPLLKVSIVPRGQALGYAMYIPEELNLYTRDRLMDMVAVTLGGRAAEEIVFNTITTGAQDDLQKVTNIVYGQLMQFGMSSTYGPSSFGSVQSQSALSKPFSEETHAMIDREARAIIEKAYEQAKTIIRENYKVFEELANRLYEREVLSYEDCEEILGKRPFQPSKTHREYLAHRSLKKENEVDLDN